MVNISCYFDVEDNKVTVVFKGDGVVTDSIDFAKNGKLIVDGNVTISNESPIILNGDLDIIGIGDSSLIVKSMKQGCPCIGARTMFDKETSAFRCTNNYEPRNIRVENIKVQLIPATPNFSIGIYGKLHYPKVSINKSNAVFYAPEFKDGRTFRPMRLVRNNNEFTYECLEDNNGENKTMSENKNDVTANPTDNVNVIKSLIAYLNENKNYNIPTSISTEVELADYIDRICKGNTVEYYLYKGYSKECATIIYNWKTMGIDVDKYVTTNTEPIIIQYVGIMLLTKCKQIYISDYINESRLCADEYNHGLYFKFAFLSCHAESDISSISSKLKNIGLSFNMLTDEQLEVVYNKVLSNLVSSKIQKRGKDIKEIIYGAYYLIKNVNIYTISNNIDAMEDAVKKYYGH